MQIDEILILKAFFNGMAIVFLNPWTLGALVFLFLLKKGFRMLEKKIKNKKIKSSEFIKNKQIEKNLTNSKSNGLCPLCGGSLREKSGKFGNFLSCSNYPSCRYTKSLK